MATAVIDENKHHHATPEELLEMKYYYKCPRCGYIWKSARYVEDAKGNVIERRRVNCSICGYNDYHPDWDNCELVEENIADGME